MNFDVTNRRPTIPPPAWWRTLKKVPRLRTQFREMGFNQNLIETKKMRDFLASVADWAVEWGLVQEDPVVFRAKFDRWAKREIMRIALQMGIDEARRQILAPTRDGEQIRS